MEVSLIILLFIGYHEVYAYSLERAQKCSPRLVIVIDGKDNSQTEDREVANEKRTLSKSFSL
jgi:hypothetical protein